MTKKIRYTIEKKDKYWQVAVLIPLKTREHARRMKEDLQIGVVRLLLNDKFWVREYRTKSTPQGKGEKNV
jgi:cupin superfamily acireductone dioxygenase involved in methionine salvage